MIEEDVAPPSKRDAAQAATLPAAFDDAVDGLIKVAMALISAIGRHAFREGARLRGELERALPRAQLLVAHLPEAARTGALSQVSDIDRFATRLLVIAPSPSTAAIVAAEAGDHTLWAQEEHAWVTRRLARRTRPQLAVPRRRRSPTRPDSPHALRKASHVCGASAAASRAGAAPDTAPAQEKKPSQ